MTTFKGWARQTGAAINQLERAAERRAREAAKNEKLRLKAELHATAEKAVETYKEVINTLTCAHKEPVENIDWNEILQETAPPAPVPAHDHEQKAAARLQNYKPSFLDKLFNSSAKSIGRLKQAVAVAKEKDHTEFEKAQTRHTAAYAQWEKMNHLANKIMAKDLTGYAEALELFHPFAETTDISAPPTFKYNPNFVEIDWYAHTGEVVPKFTLALTQAGKLSRKDLGITKYHELYREHICSYLIRAAREVLALLPVQFVIVHMLVDLVDSATGRPGEQPIVSAIIYRESLEKLNFELLDPAEAMKNFKHNMNFTKTGGFRPVEKLMAD
jgi:hypothetical protein